MKEMVKDLFKRQIEMGCCDHNMVYNVIAEKGISVMYRPRLWDKKHYFHAQVGPEEPENDTLSCHDDLGCAVLMAVLRQEGEYVFCKTIEDQRGFGV